MTDELLMALIAQSAETARLLAELRASSLEGNGGGAEAGAVSPAATAMPPSQEEGGATPTGTPEEPRGLSEIFLTVQQAAALLHWHPGSVWRLVCGGRLAGFKVGSRLLIPAESLTQFIQAGRVSPRPWAMRKPQETP